MNKESILEYFKDINHVYNDCTRYDTLKNMLDELQDPFMNKPCVAHQICHEDKIKVLDKIRAEIEKEIIPRNSDEYNNETKFVNLGLRLALTVVNKYKAEIEENK